MIKTSDKQIEEIVSRQKTLDNLNLGFLKKYVKRLVYEPKEEKSVAITEYENLNLGTKTKIIVGPKFFEYKNPKDIEGIISYHEGMHAEDYFNLDMCVMSFYAAQLEEEIEIADFYESLLEIKAYGNEKKHLSKENSQEYTKDVNLKLERYVSQANALQKKIKPPYFKKILIQAQKLKNEILEVQKVKSIKSLNKILNYGF